jgi:hypothetical protein
VWVIVAYDADLGSYAALGNRKLSVENYLLRKNKIMREFQFNFKRDTFEGYTKSRCIFVCFTNISNEQTFKAYAYHCANITLTFTSLFCGDVTEFQYCYKEGSKYFGILKRDRHLIKLWNYEFKNAVIITNTNYYESSFYTVKKNNTFMEQSQFRIIKLYTFI